MKRILILLLLIHHLCIGQQSEFRIDGRIDTSAYKPDRMILVYRSSSMAYVFDTISVKGDRFSFHGQLPEASRFKLIIEPDSSARHLSTQRKWDINFTMENCLATLQISSIGKWLLKGSSCHEDEMALRRLLLQSTKLFKGQERIEKERHIIDSFIRERPMSFYGLILFSEKVRASKQAGNLGEMFALLPAYFQNGLTGAMIRERVEKLASLERGAVAFDFKLPTLNGDSIRLSDFRGKYVLLHFWASWCNPCRQENVFLKKAYLQNASDSLVFIGVSLDEDRESLEKAIRADQLGWLQVSSLSGFETAVSKQYGVSGIPRNFLIDPMGKIVASDFRGDGIYARIQEIMQ